MLRTTAMAIVMTAAAGTAFAAGPEPVAIEAPVAVAPAPAPFWAGGYVGAQLGYAYTDFDFGDFTDGVGNAVDGDLDDSGVIGGITLGYLWSLNNGWYIGPEFQYDFADLSATDSDTGATVDFEEIARLKLIAGYELGNGLLYGSAGVAYADLDNANDIIDGFDGSDTNYVVGFGYDYRVGENWTVGGEYQYHDFDDVNLNTLHLKASYRF